jgi:transposase
MYAPGRGGEHAIRHLAGFSGTLQVDGYVAYKQLTKSERVGGPLVLANCWGHFRRQFYDIAKTGNAPIATEALQRIAALYAIEAEIRGGASEVRRAERQARSKPIFAALRPWFEENLVKISKSSPLAEHIRYGLNHWEGLVLFLDDGRIEIDSNTVERSIRPIAMSKPFCTPSSSIWKH